MGEKQAETEAKVGKPLEDRAAAKMSSPSSVDIGGIVDVVVGEPFEWSRWWWWWWWWEIRAGDDDDDVEDLGETEVSMGATAAALKSS